MLTLPVHTYAQLVPNAYLSEDLLAYEKDIIFNNNIRYAGAEALIPNPNDYVVLPQHNDGLILIRETKNQVNLLSNICRHRQAIIMNGSGSTKNISCPLHKWTYGKDGTLLAAPHFKQNPCKNLEKIQIKSWNGIFFFGNDQALTELQEIPNNIRQALNIESYYHGGTESHQCKYNWKTFIEFYLEDYHVFPFHPGLGHYVSCENLQWDFGNHWSSQSVSFYRNLQTPGESSVYKDYHQATLDYFNGQLPTTAVTWALIYPNTMIEAYPLITVISTIHPIDAKNSINHVEYYHPSDLLDNNGGSRMADIAQKAYQETAIEDNEIGERMQRGRQVLGEHRKCDFGPYHPLFEAGMEKFHEFWRSSLENLNIPLENLKN